MTWYINPSGVANGLGSNTSTSWSDGIRKKAKEVESDVKIIETVLRGNVWTKIKRQEWNLATKLLDIHIASPAFGRNPSDRSVIDLGSSMGRTSEIAADHTAPATNLVGLTLHIAKHFDCLVHVAKVE